MKKITLILVSLLVFATFANAQNFRVSAGVGGMFELQRTTYTEPGFNGGINMPFVGVSAFFDLTYAAISLSYAAQVGNPIGTEDYVSYQSYFKNYHNGYLNIRAVGKYPFQLAKGFSLFPMAGLEYDIMVADDYYSTFTAEQKADYNDLFVVLGLGTDIDLSEAIYLRIAADFDINLTATPTNPWPGASYSGVNFNAGASIGFRF